MDQFVVDALAPAIGQSVERSKRLLNAITEQFKVDWATGRATVQSEDAIVQAFLDIKGPDSEWLARSFLAMLNDGFAVYRRGVGIGVEDPSFFTVPWRALSHEATLTLMTIENWKWLGVEPWSDTQSVRQNFARQFSTIPDYMFAETRLNDLIRESASSEGRLDRPLPPMLPGGGANGDPPDGPPKGGGKPKDPPPPVDFAAQAAAILKFFQQAGQCLLQGQWSTEWVTVLGVPVYPIGMRVCLDRACADKVEDALWSLLGASAGGIVTTIGTLIAKGLLTWGALLGAGTWIFLAMIHFALNWASLISLNKTANGVCIIHFWPWNSALSGGLVNGWAEGRP